MLKVTKQVSGGVGLAEVGLQVPSPALPFGKPTTARGVFVPALSLIICDLGQFNFSESQLPSGD